MIFFQFLYSWTTPELSYLFQPEDEFSICVSSVSMNAEWYLPLILPTPIGQKERWARGGALNHSPAIVIHPKLISPSREEAELYKYWQKRFTSDSCSPESDPVSKGVFNSNWSRTEELYSEIMNMSSVWAKTQKGTIERHIGHMDSRKEGRWET